MAKGKGNCFTIEEFKQMWEKEFLPSIRKEFKIELEKTNRSITALTDRCSSIEESQKFISAKYDETLTVLQDVKKQIKSLEKKIRCQDETIATLKDQNYANECAVDEAQQYLRRDCLEITGIPLLPADNPKELVKELCAVVGVIVQDNHISTAHRLPDTKKVKDRIIVKFTHRDKREEVYKNRRKLKGKTIRNLPSVSKNLPSVNNENGQAVKTPATKIHINESLTGYRKKLFGRIYKFKKENNFKFIWTVNGKVLLKESEDSETFAFTNMEDFTAFEEGN